MATRSRTPSAADSETAHFTHFDEQGGAHMVDVGAKAVTHRAARAAGRISMKASTLKAIAAGTTRKGDVLGVARIAAIMASKRAADIIPLCHPLALTNVSVAITLDRKLPGVAIEVTCETHDRTGVEMEALTAVSAGLLTIYDMCKSADRGMRIVDIALIEKSGGRSGHFRAPGAAPKS